MRKTLKKKHGANINNKYIVLDNITSEFLKNLRSLRKEKKFSLDFVAHCLGTTSSNIISYEKGTNVPTLLRFIKLAELLDFDISASINYKFFYGKIRTYKLLKALDAFDFSLSEISQITGYCERCVNDAINLSPYASIHCLYAVIQLVQRERNSLALREKLIKERTATRDYSE